MPSFKDIIGRKELMFRGNTHSFENDRSSKPKSAIYLNNSYLEGPSNNYFSENFSFLVWVKLKTNKTWTTVLNFSDDLIRYF